MNRLAPTLFDRRYDDLVELGRSRLPSLAPEWTDHNAHDPGITLMELLAWVAEAQLYSLGRSPRRDERLAYAALVGLAPNGTRPARGLIWADRTDPASPAATFAGSRVIETDAAVRLQGHDEPVFHPEHRILWVPGRIVGLWSRLADGRTFDLAASNDRGAPFLPFGERAGPRDVVVLEFETRGDAGLFPARRDEARDASLVIGVRAADDGAVVDDGEPAPHQCDAFSMWLVAGTNRFSLPVVKDSTAGLLRTGVLVLDVSQVRGSPRSFSLEIQSPRGFVRPPRWRRIEPNVLPITASAGVERELQVANGQPEFGFDLGVPGLCFEPGTEPLRVEVRTDTEFQEWKRCDRLSDEGPESRVYELDAARAHLLFGNGVNGRKPGAGAQLYVSYFVSSGQHGNVAPNRKWMVAGFGGVFGTNPDPIAGGADGTDWTDLRRSARRHAKEDHALVTAADIEAAAVALPLLEVARAWVPPRAKGPQTGTVTLVVMRVRRGAEPAEPPETRRWLEVVRRRLAGRMPLGARLVVVAPRYVDFFVRAELEIEQGRDPAKVATAVNERLEKKLARVASPSTPEPRRPGVPVARTEVAAWMLRVDGVARVLSLELVHGRTVMDEIQVPHGGLPRFQSELSTIRAARPETRSGR